MNKFLRKQNRPKNVIETESLIIQQMRQIKRNMAGIRKVEAKERKRMKHLLAMQRRMLRGEIL